MPFDFDQICIILAAILAATSIPKYRNITLILFLNFAVYEIIANPMIEALGGGEAWPLHVVYILTSGLTIVVLVNLGASWTLYGAMFLYTLYHFVIVCEFSIGKFGAHELYEYVARAQMAIELIFMLLMNGLTKYVWSKRLPSRSHDYFVDRFFVNGIRLGGQRIL